MSWRAGVTALIVIFALVVVWITLAGPLVEVGEAFKAIDTSGQFNAGSKIDSWIKTWFNMILVAIFGIMAWAVWWVYRREKTRTGL
jgi:hypothetical protein